MPPPSHMERRRSIDVSHATPSLYVNEIIPLLCVVSSVSLCIFEPSLGDVVPCRLLEPCGRTRDRSEEFVPLTQSEEA